MLLSELKTDSKTLNVILEGWFEVKQHLSFDFKADCIPAGTTIRQAFLLMNFPRKGIGVEGKRVLAYTRV